THTHTCVILNITDCTLDSVHNFFFKNPLTTKVHTQAHTQPHLGMLRHLCTHTHTHTHAHTHSHTCLKVSSSRTGGDCALGLNSSSCRHTDDSARTDKPF